MRSLSLTCLLFSLYTYGANEDVLMGDAFFYEVHRMFRNVCLCAFKLLGVFLLVILYAGCQDNIPVELSYTYSDLVNKLVDLEALARLPEPGEKTALWSSYDRRSVYDKGLDDYLHWSANEDSLGSIRKEGDYLVLAEMEGPGCIWRIWSAVAHAGHVTIYLDGKLLPSVDLPFEHYFDGTQFPFYFSELVYNDAAKGKNNYIPIPYQTSCKIVAPADQSWGEYYHFTYTSFPKNTTLPTFNRTLSPEALFTLSKTNFELKQKKGEYPYADHLDDQVIQDAVFLEAGDTVSLADISGQYAITAIKFYMDFTGVNRHDKERMLRKMVFQIKWDNEIEASVWSPLGDFFGTAPGVNEYKTLPLGMTEDMFYSYWYMPFKERAQLEIINEDDVHHRLEYEIIYRQLNQPIDTLGRFHAKWHQDAFPVESGSRWPDWTLLKTEGKGRFVGMMLSVWNPRSGRCSPDVCGEGSGWWGEGDEKFFVDGEKFPSLFGTGTEDYFGFANCTAQFFEKAFHSQSLAAENNIGYMSSARWHIADNIPFQKSFEGFIEKYWPNAWPTQYSTVVYWYLSSNGHDPHRPMPLKEINEGIGSYNNLQ